MPQEQPSRVPTRLEASRLAASLQPPAGLLERISAASRRRTRPDLSRLETVAGPVGLPVKTWAVLQPPTRQGLSRLETAAGPAGLQDKTSPTQRSRLRTLRATSSLATPPSRAVSLARMARGPGSQIRMRPVASWLGAWRPQPAGSPGRI